MTERPDPDPVDRTVGVDRAALAAAGDAVEAARRPGRRRVSPIRLLVVSALTVVSVAGVVWAAREFADRAEALIDDERSDVDVIPYVDVTLPPIAHFEDSSVNPATTVALGFVVAAIDEPCTPTWGTFYDMDGAARALDLDRRVERHRERGGEVIVSFGGQANDELAVVCEDPEALVAAYRSVIDRYGSTTIDLDVEGAALADAASIVRRAEAVAELQRQPGPRVEVWLTLPVAPTGLTESGISVVDAMLDAGVELAGVNAMTMNYGGSRESSDSMAEASIDALRSVHGQLDDAYARVGRSPSDAELWSQVGATPMIGRNDVAEDVFDLDDAERLGRFASSVDLGRMSYWSLNRDQTCGVREDGEPPSPVCSGVDQHDLEFMFRLGSLDEVDLDAWVEGEAAVLDTDGATRDDPDASPYPIWRERENYEGGSKVVWRGEVYIAKWWADAGVMPGTPVEHPWDTPWRRLGPVLDADGAYVAESTAEAVDLPTWEPATPFTDGERVVHEGNVFEARWWSVATEPELRPDDPYSHPWEHLGDVDGGLDGPAGPARWTPAAVYERGVEVLHRGQRFEARWWNTDVEPDPFPEYAFDHPWQLLGDE